MFELFIWYLPIELIDCIVFRLKCYEILVKKVREIDGCADINYVRSKIESFRSAYRREKSKVAKSIKAGKKAYKPVWCFYPKLAFIDFSKCYGKGLSSLSRRVDTAERQSESPISNKLYIDSDDCVNITINFINLINQIEKKTCTESIKIRIFWESNIIEGY